MTIIVTGGAGFIGSNFIFHMLGKYPDYRIVCLDKLTYAGSLSTLVSVMGNPNFRFVKADICDRAAVYQLFEEEHPDMVVNFAAESHVDRSIENPEVFLQTNILGTQVLMDACRKYGIKRYHQVSTDEVYGDLPLDRPDLFFTEETPIHTSSPYSSSKASADLLVLAYHRTYGLPVTVSRCSNNYGPYQFPEKLIPLMIANCLNDKPLPVYGEGLNVRDWLYVEDHCKAIDLIIHNGRVGEVYNIGGHNEMRNIDIVTLICKTLGKPESLITYVTDRKGHDMRYAIDPAKIHRELGWLPETKFADGIQKTIQWYLDNREWWETILSGEYQNYYEKMYGSSAATHTAATPSPEAPVLKYSINYDCLRPKKAAWLKRMYNTPFAEKKNLSLWQGKNATVFPLREVPGDDVLFGRGGVIDEGGNYVPLSGIEKRIKGRYPFENPGYKDEKVVYCGYLVNHWGHFLVEAVTRLWYVLQNDPTIDKYVFFVDEGEDRVVKGNYRRFFELLKIWDKLELVNTPTTFREVIVPEISFQNMTFHSPQYLAIFDAIAENAEVNPAWERAEKVFLTRSQFASQNGYEFGLEAFDDFYTRNGYTVVAPEKLPLDQLIYLLRNAEEVVSISGSTAHNLLFGQSGQKLTILERLIINDDHQVCINQMRALQVTPVDANFHLYPVDTCGPYILGYSPCFNRYYTDKGLLPPSGEYASSAYLEKCFKQYMFSYFDNYQHRWFMADWYPEICDSLYEAYLDSFPYFQDYLEDRKPFLRKQYFQVHYWKQFVKRVIHRA